MCDYIEHNFQKVIANKSSALSELKTHKLPDTQLLSSLEQVLDFLKQVRTKQNNLVDLLALTGLSAFSMFVCLLIY